MCLNNPYKREDFTELENNSETISSKKPNISDIQDIFEENIGKYCYLQTFSYGYMFIIIRGVDKRNNLFSFDELYNRRWYYGGITNFNNIIRYEIFNTKESGTVDFKSCDFKCCVYRAPNGTVIRRCVPYNQSCPYIPGYNYEGWNCVDSCTNC